MTGHQIQAVRAEYLRLADDAAKSGKHEAKVAFDHAAEILLQARLDSENQSRSEFRAFIAARVDGSELRAEHGTAKPATA